MCWLNFPWYPSNHTEEVKRNKIIMYVRQTINQFIKCWCDSNSWQNICVCCVCVNNMVQNPYTIPNINITFFTLINLLLKIYTYIPK